MDVLVATLLGIIASLLAWLTVTHSLRPRVDVSGFVSRIDDASGPRYRIKIKNQRRRRNAVDIRADTYLWIPGFYPDRPGNKRVIRVTASSTELVGLRPGDDRILVLEIQEAAAQIDSDSPHENELEKLLDRGTSGSAQLRLWLSFTDGYSGVRRAKFQAYSVDDIHRYLFDPQGVGRGRPSGEASSSS